MCVANGPPYTLLEALATCGSVETAPLRSSTTAGSPESAPVTVHSSQAHRDSVSEVSRTWVVCSTDTNLHMFLLGIRPEPVRPQA